MKKFLLLFAFIVFILLASAQTKTLKEQKTDSIGKVVIQYLKDHRTDDIYKLTGDEFKSQLSLPDFKKICETQIFPMNDFKNVTFEKTENGINKYKVAGTPELQILIGIDDKDQLRTFFIQPYSAN